jgi:DNA damage-binding protein 1
VLLFNFGNDASPKGADHHAFLLAGLGDGSLASMLWKDNKLMDLMVVSLGHAPVSLTPFQVDDQHTVLAAGNRATVFFYDSKKNRLANSPIMLKVGILVFFFSSRQTQQGLNQEISAAARFVTSSFTSSLILASPAGLFVGRVRQLDKMNIRSVGQKKER